MLLCAILTLKGVYWRGECGLESKKEEINRPINLELLMSLNVIVI